METNVITSPTVMRCAVCGGDRVHCDATATWNKQTQAWELAGVMDGDWCDDCETDTVILEAVS